MTTEAPIRAGSQTMVGMAEFVVSKDEAVTLCSYPLGACLGVAIYDPTVKVGGMMHSLLPASAIDPQRAADRPGMFLDSGLNAMLERAVALGARKEHLLLIIAGGAQIMDETSLFNIGKRNYEVLTGLLAQLGLKIHAEDVGGRTNRTMQLKLADGEVRLKFSGQATIKTLCKP